MRVLLIDDEKGIEADLVARTFEEGMDAIENKGPWDLVLLDHDLGTKDPKKTGYDILCHVRDNMPIEKWPVEFKLISMNPAGMKRMNYVLGDLVRKMAESGWKG